MKQRPTWVDSWKSRRFRVQASITILMQVIVLAVFSRFLEFVEARPGVVPGDPLLPLLEPRDVTWLTFTLIYAALIIALVPLVRHPRNLLLALQSYTVLVLFRMIGMYLLPLDPPPGMIALKDPFVEYFVGTGSVLTRDLFFSGHTSTMFLLFLTATSIRFRFIFLCATALVGFCVLWQHVHYSVDVLAAPFFAYGSFRLVALMDRWLNGPRRALLMQEE